MKNFLTTIALATCLTLQMNAQIEHHKGNTNYTPPPSEMNSAHVQNDISNTSLFGRKAQCSNNKFDIMIIENSNGVVIKEVPLPEGPLQLSNLPSGNYIISTVSQGRVTRSNLTVK
ncbi:MAG: hypothetical protein AB8B53_15140 [Flavobacteriales bacterium]